MFNGKSLLRSVVVCAGVLTVAWTSAAQIPAPAPEKPPMRVELKPTFGQSTAGALGGLGVAFEFQAVQPNVPNGLRGTIVITNPGAGPVEFIDPRDSSQLEIQTAAGKSLRPVPVAPASLVNVPGAKSPAPIRLAPKESRRIDIGVTEVLGEGPAPGPAVPSPASPGAPRSNSLPLSEGAYRVRARVRIIAAQGKAGESRPSPTFESPWLDVTLGAR